MSVAHGVPLLLRLGGLLSPRSIVTRDVTLSPGGRPYPAKLYWPEGDSSERLPGLYLQHGMTVTGVADPRMDQFARNLASCGFAVVMPALDTITRLEITPTSIDEIEALYLELTRRSDLVDTTRCGFAAAGFSAGMGLAALSRPAVSDKVAAVFGVGAYGRFRETVEAAVTQLDRDPYGAFLILANFILRLRPRAAALKAVLLECAARAWRNQPPVHVDEAPQLSSDEGELLGSLTSDRTFRRALVLEILQQLSPSEIDQLSPAAQIGRIRGPVVLIHGRDDPSVPADESRWLASRLTSVGADVTLVVTSALSHGDPEPLWKSIPDVPALAGAFGRFVLALKAGPTERA